MHRDTKPFACRPLYMSLPSRSAALCLVIILIAMVGAVSPSMAEENTLHLQHVRQYMLPLRDGRQAVVIEGEVLNGTGATLDHVAVTATLYDRDGSVIASGRRLCGSVFSQKRLAAMDTQAVAAAFASGVSRTRQSGAATVPPRHSVPFMVVFPDENMLYEYSVSAYRIDIGGTNASDD